MSYILLWHAAASRCWPFASQDIRIEAFTPDSSLINLGLTRLFPLSPIIIQIKSNRPGSILYFPSGYWHHVVCDDDEGSLSINFAMYPSTCVATTQTQSILKLEFCFEIIDGWICWKTRWYNTFGSLDIGERPLWVRVATLHPPKLQIVEFL